MNRFDVTGVSSAFSDVIRSLTIPEAIQETSTSGSASAADQIAGRLNKNDLLVDDFHYYLGLNNYFIGSRR